MEPGDVLSYREMCETESASLQRGMNFRLGGKYSVVLMSRRPNAPYRDRIEDGGRTIVYEGHDLPRSAQSPDPKIVDQPIALGSRATQNGLFLAAAEAFRTAREPAATVRVYEKLYSGVWVYNGTFALSDAWSERSNDRLVWKFRLEIIEEVASPPSERERTLIEHTRVVPSDVKLAVWRRDRGRCVQCGLTDNLHFDHIIPFSRGGSSLVEANIQILCARHNLEKRDAIQ